MIIPTLEYLPNRVFDQVCDSKLLHCKVLFCHHSPVSDITFPFHLSISLLQQPHSIVQRRLLEGNISRLCGEAWDTPSRVRSPLADSKEGAEAEEKSESTVDDSTEERESPEESEKSLRSDEDDEEDEYPVGKAVLKEKWMEAGRDSEEAGPEERKKVSNLSALQVQCKV